MMEDIFQLIVPFLGLLIPVFFLMLGLAIGSWAESSHFKRIAAREQHFAQMVQTQSKVFLAPQSGAPAPKLICAETVVASDYFKNFLAAFRKFFGGEMRSYNSLMERARRETLVRILEIAQRDGYNAVCNVRLETADVGGSNVGRKKAWVMASILGSATAYCSDLAKLVPAAKNAGVNPISPPGPPQDV